MNQNILNNVLMNESNKNSPDLLLNVELSNKANETHQKLEDRTLSKKNTKEFKSRIKHYTVSGIYSAMKQICAKCITKQLFTHLQESENNSTTENSMNFVNIMREPMIVPDLSIKNKGKKTLVLDLDETLVHAEHSQFNSDFALQFENQTSTKIFVKCRPGITEFLDQMKDYYEIIVFTASLQEYALPVMEAIDVNKQIDIKLFRENCIFYKGIYVKDLSRLGNRSLKDIIIIDNSRKSFVLQPQNAILIKSFIDDENDHELINLIPFLKFSAKQEEVRPMNLLLEKFQQYQMEMNSTQEIQNKQQQNQQQQNCFSVSSPRSQYTQKIICNNNKGEEELQPNTSQRAAGEDEQFTGNATISQNDSSNVQNNNNDQQFQKDVIDIPLESAKKLLTMRKQSLNEIPIQTRIELNSKPAQNNYYYPSQTDRVPEVLPRFLRGEENKLKKSQSKFAYINDNIGDDQDGKEEWGDNEIKLSIRKYSQEHIENNQQDNILKRSRSWSKQIFDEKVQTFRTNMLKESRSIEILQNCILSPNSPAKYKSKKNKDQYKQDAKQKQQQNPSPSSNKNQFSNNKNNQY